MGGLIMSLIRMPRLSDSMQEGKLLRWCVRPGDFVKVGDVLAEIETDKANMEIEALEQGWIAELYGKPGDAIPVGEPIVRLASSLEEVAQAERAHSSAPPASIVLEDLVGTEPEPSIGADASGISYPRENVSPLAKQRAAELGVEITKVQGTGPGGRVMEADVLAAAATKSSDCGGTAFQEDTGTISLVELQPVASEGRQKSQQEFPPPCCAQMVDFQSVSLRTQINAGSIVNWLPHLQARLNLPSGCSSELLIQPIVAKAVMHALESVPTLRESIAHPEATRGAVAFTVRLRDQALHPVMRSIHVSSLSETIKNYWELRERCLAGSLSESECRGAELVVDDVRQWGVEAPTFYIHPYSVPLVCIGSAVGKEPTHWTVSASFGKGDKLDPALIAEFLRCLRLFLEQPILMYE